MALITPDSGAGFSCLTLFILHYKPWQASMIRPILQRKKLKLEIATKGHTVLKCYSQASNTLILTLESVCFPFLPPHIVLLRGIRILARMPQERGTGPPFSSAF